MQPSTSAASRWQQLDGRRQSFLTRCERYSALTLPKLCPPKDYDQEQYELQHDYQSLGAQAVNHLANKIMLALFAPSRPFFRLDLTPALQAELQKQNITSSQAAEILAQGEKKAVRELDRLAVRPQLIEGIKHLIVLGNFLLVLDKDNIRVHGIRKYCVRRSGTGKVVEIILAEKMAFDELEQSVQDTLSAYAEFKDAATSNPDVTLYKWIVRNRFGDYEMTQWVNSYQLPKKFNGKWSEENLPYLAMTWDLSSDAHYGTGLVEDYGGDFIALSQMSEAQVVGAILAAEFRWLANPAGQTKPDDVENSRNGAVLPGVEGDITILENSKSKDLSILLEVISEYTKRIARGFLMGSAVTRDAERVTAEEIRMQANELETAYGGVYSRQAQDLQLPLARWLLKRVGLDKGVDPVIVTGVEALSRQGDLDDLKLWLSDMAAANNLPEGLQARIRFDALAQALAAPRRIQSQDFVKSDQEFQAEVQQQQQQQMQAQAAQVGVEAGAKVAVEKQKQSS